MYCLSLELRKFVRSHQSSIQLRYFTEIRQRNKVKSVSSNFESLLNIYISVSCLGSYVIV